MANGSFSVSSPLRVPGRPAVFHHSYAGLAVEAQALRPVNELLAELLEERFAELKGNRDSRDGDSKYHLTVIEPREFRALAKEQKRRGERVEIPETTFAVEILGVGTAVGSSSQSWFAVCRSGAAAAWRERLGLEPKDFHITLAFEAGGDVHGVAKDAASLITVGPSYPPEI